MIIYKRDKLEPIYKNEQLFDKGNPSDPDEAVIELCKNVEPLIYLSMNTEAACNRAVRSLVDHCNREIFLCCKFETKG